MRILCNRSKYILLRDSSGTHENEADWSFCFNLDSNTTIRWHLLLMKNIDDILVESFVLWNHVGKQSPEGFRFLLQERRDLLIWESKVLQP